MPPLPPLPLATNQIDVAPLVLVRVLLVCGDAGAHPTERDLDAREEKRILGREEGGGREETCYCDQFAILSSTTNQKLLREMNGCWRSPSWNSRTVILR